MADVREALRLVGDCRDVGRDRAAWNAVLVRGLSARFGCYMTNGFALWADAGGGPIVADRLADDWPDDANYRWWLKHIQDEGLRHQPSVAAFLAPFTATTTRRRADLIPDAEWERCPERTVIRARANQDEFIYSATPINGGPGFHGLTLNRAVGAPGFTAAERELVELIHDEVGALLGTKLVLQPNPLLSGLTPRVRAVLATLIEGETEKQIAARLGLSPHTVHEYVGTLYRHFGVRTRAALVAAYLRAGPAAPSAQL